MQKEGPPALQLDPELEDQVYDMVLACQEDDEAMTPAQVAEVVEAEPRLAWELFKDMANSMLASVQSKRISWGRLERHPFVGLALHRAQQQPLHPGQCQEALAQLGSDASFKELWVRARCCLVLMYTHLPSMYVCIEGSRAAEFHSPNPLPAEMASSTAGCECLN